MMRLLCSFLFIVYTTYAQWHLARRTHPGGVSADVLLGTEFAVEASFFGVSSDTNGEVLVFETAVESYFD